MKWYVGGIILILAAVGMLAGHEAVMALGPPAGIVLAAGMTVAFVFSTVKGKAAMVVNRGARMDADDDGDGRPVRIVRLTEQDKKEIVDAVFDRIFAEVGKNAFKRAFIVFISIILAVVGWLAKNHIDIK